MKKNLYLLILLFFIGSLYKVYCQCQNYHFQASSCTNETVVSTTTPLILGCEHWPEPVINNDPHVARYQNQLTINAPTGPDRTIQFSANDAQSLMDWARGYWSQQCSTPRGLIWQTTATGGRFWWATRASDIGATTFAIGNSALDPNNFSHIVDSTNCSPSSPRGISEILFNNTNEMYTRLPQYRWTTTPNACNGTQFTCLDFQGIALHELGHYVGLAHDGSQTSVMAGGYRGRIVVFEMCDVDRFRRLYCLNSVGRPVDVKEEIRPDEIKLEIFPNPSSNFFTLKFNLKSGNHISIYISDNSGKEISLIADEIFNDGNHEISFPIFDIPSGNYFIRLEFDKTIISQKFIIIK